jgi:N6-adenosine-specific RNA methylase IME4
VASICERNAVLFLWTTSPMLFEAFSVIEAWGFTYKASFVWDKHAHNMGHYNSVRHEYLLVCVRGSCPPDVPKLFDSVQKTGRTEHSEKPNVFRIIIETLYPYGKRVELFAREQVDGWTAWGNEVAVASV